MSAYENVVGGKLKLKGKALNVKPGGLKKKKKQKKHYDQVSEVLENELSAGLNILFCSSNLFSSGSSYSFLQYLLFT